MPPEKQKIRSILIPEIDLTLEPEFISEFLVTTEFIRSISHLAARTGNRSIMLKATSDGRLSVATAGTSMEIYSTHTGNAPDAYDAPNTYNLDDAHYLTDILIEDFAAEISFRNLNGVYGDDKIIPVGFSSIDFIHYGCRIQNRVALSVAAYEFTFYR